MNTGFKFQCKPKYRILDEDQIKTIHRATLQLLETTGVSVKHPEAIGLLTSAGCRIKSGDIVQIPGALVEECIKSAPSCIKAATFTSGWVRIFYRPMIPKAVNCGRPGCRMWQTPLRSPTILKRSILSHPLPTPTKSP